MKRRKWTVTILAFIAFISILTAGCSAASESENPEWVDQMIKTFKSDPVGNPPQSIWRYDYNGQTVYYVPAQCCDMYSTLYDASGNILCAPDGGITGKGDGRCEDFQTKRTNKLLVWEDTRKR